MELAQAIKNKALDLGFHAAGITTADPIDPAHIQALTQWIEQNHAADLKYMRNNFQKRTHPAFYLQNARSVICVALHYKPPRAPQGKARIANFALYDDYHPFIKERLLRLADFIQSLLPAGFSWQFKAAVDTAPLAERALAQRAGIGFIGKNHMLIHPSLGSQLLLGQLVTTLDLPPDPPLKTRGCRDCNLCLRACPTGALSPDGTFLTRRCISYLTQYADNMAGFEQQAGNRLFGCDTCLLACPYERQAPPSQNPGLLFYPQRGRLDPADILRWDPDQFDEQFKNSCLQSIGLEKLKKNARICTDNQEKTQLDE